MLRRNFLEVLRFLSSCRGCWLGQQNKLKAGKVRRVKGLMLHAGGGRLGGSYLGTFCLGVSALSPFPFPWSLCLEPILSRTSSTILASPKALATSRQLSPEGNTTTVRSQMKTSHSEVFQMFLTFLVLCVDVGPGPDQGVHRRGSGALDGPH